MTEEKRKGEGKKLMEEWRVCPGNLFFQTPCVIVRLEFDSSTYTME